MEIQYATISKIGSRAANQDRVAAMKTDHGFAFVLADGLGGHDGGEIAAVIAAQAVESASTAPGLDQSGRLAAGATNAQVRILEEQRRTAQPNGLKTTLVVLDIENNFAQWLHIGDSRLYWFTGARLVGHTLDHSVPQMLVSQGKIQEKDIRFHEDRNRLTRVLGVDEESPRFTLSDPLALTPPMSFLLCSDGFWELTDEKTMCRHLKLAIRAQDWLMALEGILLKKGRGRNMDNYSAIAVFVR